jgi:release factor glutamine methyltransferase
MREFIKKITHPFLKLGLKLFYFKPRKYCYEDICIKVHPDVFPPHLTLSTKILLDFIKPIELENKSFLELGCGSGIISLLASKKRAKVLASDINETALEFLNENAEKNKLSVTTIYSDLFDSIENSTFDFIIINPPYYPKNPINIKEKAWYCGTNFEYFEKLFVQLPLFLSDKTICHMILSEDCEIETIKTIAKKNRLEMKCIEQKTVMKEINYIFKIEKN